jgi:6-pyruvoyltetrahydropterin/6-carboxytetrahydropterin synthase
LEAVIAEHQDKTLNELPAFAGLNPSIEHFSRILCDALAGPVSAPNLTDLSVKLWENDIAWASYRKMLP